MSNVEGLPSDVGYREFTLESSRPKRQISDGRCRSEDNNASRSFERTLTSYIRYSTFYLLTFACIACSSSPPPAPAAPPEPAAPAPVVIESRGEIPNLKVQALSVERVSPGVVEVKLGFVNEGAPESPPIAIGSSFASLAADEGTVADVFVHDPGGQRKFYVLRDADGRPLCSTSIEPIAPGELRTVWAKFAAPPEGVSQVDIHVPHMEPLLAVGLP